MKKTPAKWMIPVEQNQFFADKFHDTTDWVLAQHTDVSVVHRQAVLRDMLDKLCIAGNA